MLSAAIALLLCAQQGEVKDLPAGPLPHGFLSFCFSPDSKRILYSKVDDAKNFDPAKRNIWIANVDGTNRELVTSGVGLAEWFGDDKTLLYIKSVPTGGELCRFDLQTKTEASFGIKMSVRSATYSAAIKRLVFAADLGNGNTQAFTCDADGKDIRQITFGPGKVFNPMWAPDGTRITFYRELGDGKDQIYVARADGTEAKRLSDPAQHNFYPDFGPTGIVSFTVMLSEKDKRVVAHDMEGKRLGQFPYRTSRLRWSPDGSLAAFVVGEFPTTALYVCDDDGGNPIRIGND